MKNEFLFQMLVREGRSVLLAKSCIFTSNLSVEIITVTIYAYTTIGVIASFASSTKKRHITSNLVQSF